MSSNTSEIIISSSTHFAGHSNQSQSHYPRDVYRLSKNIEIIIIIPLNIAPFRELLLGWPKIFLLFLIDKKF